MPNVTITLDDSVLEQARSYAEENGISFNELVVHLIKQAVSPQEGAWLQEIFDLADRNGWRSAEKWSREDAYDANRVRCHLADRAQASAP
jgi:Family of unknown function (DUF6364)